MATRRELLTRAGAAGGVGFAYLMARELGVIRGEDAWAGAPDLTAHAGQGARVVILGAGLAGLAAAIELSSAGYACTVLEARERIGGRVWTLRRGDPVAMTDGSRQVCDFDSGLYLNAGAARIPSDHQAVLGYCRELKIPLETLVNYSGTALIQSDRLNGGRPFQMRQAVHDARGHMAELLAASVRGGGLDRAMSKEDTERLVAAAASWGQLVNRGSPAADPSVAVKRPVDPKGELVYAGATSAGFSTPPGAGDQLGVANRPLPREVVLDPFVITVSNIHEVISMQATMLQPFGGMDRLPNAMAAALAPDVVKLGCEVKQIRRRSSGGREGVAITYRERGRERQVEADYCLCTLPLKVLAQVPSDFSADRKTAIQAATYINASKIAFQAPRFWERVDQIYGGLSLTDRDTLFTWYPSDGFGRDQGVLVASYALADRANRLGALPADRRLAYARETIERLHPGRSGDLSRPLEIDWGKTPFSLGFACSLDEQDPAAYRLLGEPDGPFWFAGEHLSHVGAWQQGAIVSAHRAAVRLDARHRQGAPITAVRAQS